MSNQLSQHYILSLDSSMTVASVSLGAGGVLIDSIVLTRQKSHSEQINKAIELLLSKNCVLFSQVCAVAVTEGPGSFTGLRIAGNIAKTICYCLNIPMIVLNSLDILKTHTLNQINSSLKDACIKKFTKQNFENENTIICSMVNAFKQMVFVSVDQLNGTIILPPTLMTLDEVMQYLITSYSSSSILIVGDGFDYYELDWSKDFLNLLLIRPKDEYKPQLDYPSVDQITISSFEKYKTDTTIDWKEFLPLYLKHSEAEENLRLGKLKFRNIGDI